MDEILFSINNLSFGYRKEKLFNNINFNMYKGEFLALLGSNGSGKTSLIKLILGQEIPSEGQVIFEDKDLNIGYVPQINPGSSYNFPITCSELVSLSLYKELKGFKRINPTIKERIYNSLKQVGMQDYKDKLFQDLSGGQRQRVLIAKALVSRPDFIILDEPTNGVDKDAKKSIYELLNHINKFHKISILIVTHELRDVDQYISRKVILDNGQIVRDE